MQSNVLETGCSADGTPRLFEVDQSGAGDIATIT
jgi:hypothetical protein